MEEKILLREQDLPLPNNKQSGSGAAKKQCRRRRWATSALLTSLALMAWTHCGSGPLFAGRNPVQKQPQCAQVAPLRPNATSAKLDEMDGYLKSSAFKDVSVARLSGAVRIPTVSYDDLSQDVSADPRWQAMPPFVDYLAKTFPLVHEKLVLDKINTHGLLYTWQGSEKSLKPTLLMAHYDVVPVANETVGSWTHPPFSGHFDGHYVWGRGSMDCKNSLIGILSAVEALLEAGFSPRRTVLLSFGFDEEISGARGAGHLAPEILSRYGKDGVAILVDEGAGMKESWGTAFALPGVAEKGYMDVDVVVRMPGGHSSIPLPHNGIGVMSQLIVALEDNPYSPRLSDENPYLSLLQCGNDHGEDFPKGLSKLLDKRGKGRGHCRKDPLAEEAAKAGAGTKYLFTTSFAPDIIHGGVKVNALPERTALRINYRINVGETTEQVRDRLKHLAGKVAARHNLTLNAFSHVPSGNVEEPEDDDEEPSSITLRVRRAPLEPAPVTPTSVEGVTPYAVLSGTTRALYGEELVVAPSLMTGNTDTRYYWDVTKHIFRYMPAFELGSTDDFMDGIHTVNEKASIGAHVNGVAWFSLFIRNMDEVELD
ncbi:hypothetical protein ACKVV1_008310 [Pyricularia oryzae]